MNKAIKNQSGFTFVEIIVALGITVFLVAAIYMAYLHLYKTVSCEDIKIVAQQKARAAAELMQREIRHAGSRVVKTATNIAPGFSNTQIAIRYKDPVTDEMLRMTYRSGASELQRERCVIDAVTDTGDWNTCVGTAAFVTVVDNLKSLDLKYFDKNGNATSSASEVSYVKFTIEVEGEAECQDGIRPEVAITTEVKPKNLW